MQSMKVIIIMFVFAIVKKGVEVMSVHAKRKMEISKLTATNKKIIQF